jgi:hypothetical protein
MLFYLPGDFIVKKTKCTPAIVAPLRYFLQTALPWKTTMSLCATDPNERIQV